MPVHNATSDEIMALMQADLNAGDTHCVIGRRHGVHPNTVSKMVRSGRLKTKTTAAPAKPRKALSARGIFPNWVPRDLRPEYYDNARLYGEEHAARLARAAKAAATAVGA